MLTQELLRQLLDYCPDTGVFVWKVDKGYKIKAGKKAGYHTSSGYCSIQIDGQAYQSHRLAFLYMTSIMPSNKEEVDHIDGNRLNNKWCNLRLGSKRQNQQNRDVHRAGHLVGTCWHKDIRRWIASITINRKNKHLGCFDTQEQAHEAYKQYIKENSL